MYLYPYLFVHVRIYVSIHKLVYTQGFLTDCTYRKIALKENTDLIQSL